MDANKIIYTKRDDVLSWDQYYMAVAQIVRLRSKDPKTQVGAVIVKDHRILSTGYNGFPLGISDDEFPWDKGNPNLEDNKYAYVVHAELNAILNYKQDLSGATLYVTLFPCNECAKAIIQAGIRKIYYLDEDDPNKSINIASRRMLEAIDGIELIRYKDSNPKTITVEV